MCRVPESEWPGAGDQEVIDAIKLDFMGEWGDRRQECEFGANLDLCVPNTVHNIHPPLHFGP